MLGKTVYSAEQISISASSLVETSVGYRGERPYSIAASRGRPPYRVFEP